MQITEETVVLLKKYNLPINCYFVLYCLANGLAWYKIIGEDRVGTFQTLTRRGFITYDHKITKEGLDVLSGQLEVIKKKKPLNSEEQISEWQENFAEFWDLYPTSDKFKHWERTRSLRVNKLKAFKLFCDILAKKEYTYQDLKKALLLDIKSKQNSSLVENQFKYMQAITSWLSKGIYEGYISELKSLDEDVNTTDRTILE